MVNGLLQDAAIHANVSGGMASQAAFMGARDARQATIAEWARACFGVEQSTSLPQRAVRLLEESIEAYQAAGGDLGMARELVDFVFARPPGELAQELGGVSVCLLVIASALGMTADGIERTEVERVLAKPIQHFTERNEAKNAAGFLARPPAVAASASPPKDWEIRDIKIGNVIVPPETAADRAREATAAKRHDPSIERTMIGGPGNRRRVRGCACRSPDVHDAKTWAAHIGIPGAEHFIKTTLALKDAAQDAIDYPARRHARTLTRYSTTHRCVHISRDLITKQRKGSHEDRRNDNDRRA